ncbi:tyrosine-type recombinase/integrase [Aquariibacter albus]|uniref:Tyrosine recombinase XerC n=1 Tax=Aquariibacter albus TaxID=2759899 RepID=A0A839HLE6_9BURK|nr:tyrosine-type recombinase/integrase [Aquariibacter albus]MBB1163043.1 tyrosine-type recombinase/integrase [Aquariibacter albus]
MAGPDDVPARPEAGSLAAHLEHLRVERRLAPASLRAYTAALQRLADCAAAEGLALPEVQTGALRRWAARLHGEGLAPRSLAQMLSAWRGYYGWLGQRHGLRANPAEGLRAPKAPRLLPKALSVEEAVALAEHRVAEPADPRLEARDRCIVELLYGCGLRVAELCSLDLQAGPQALGWIDRGAAEAHVLGKGRKRRSLPVGRAALAALADWLAQRPALAAPDEPALLLNRSGRRISPSQVRSRLRERAARAGLPQPVHPHMLRHSYASHLLQSSGELRGVQELLGHASIATTQVYTRLDWQHLAKAYDAAHPRARRKPGEAD